MKALVIICNMSVSSTYRKVLAMSSVGLIETLVNIIKNDDGQLRLESFVIIGNLLTNKENIRKLASPSLRLIELLKDWKNSYDESRLNNEDNNIFLYLQQMIEILESNCYNSEFPSLVRQLSPSLNSRIFV